MSGEPRVSVVVPLYNKASYIRRCLDSILRQSFHDFEAIVVDDGSRDGGGALVQAYSDPRVRLISQHNAGPGAARNRGIREARAPYVAFLDADDEWLPEYLERGVAFLDAHPEAAAHSSGYLEEPQQRSSEAVWRKRGLRDGVITLTADSSPLYAVHLLTCMSPCTTIARREKLLRWGGFYDRARHVYGEDNELCLKLLLNESIGLSAEPLMIWHSDASELSRNVRGPRLVEVFLLDPQGLYDACPPERAELLRAVLAIRACKTACMLGFWGEWREGRRLADQYSTPADWRWNWVWLGYLCATPFGAWAGRLYRRMHSGMPGKNNLGSTSWE